MDGAWRNKSKSSAVPLTKLQSEVLRVLAAERSPDSYIAGGVALNREGPRFSRDIDIFQDSQRRLETAAEADAKALTGAGFNLSWKKIKDGKREAEVEGLGERMLLDGSPTALFVFSRRGRMSFSAMSCTPSILRQTRRLLLPTVANPATSLIL
jgi:hypothetical protein